MIFIVIDTLKNIPKICKPLATVAWEATAPFYGLFYQQYRVLFSPGNRESGAWGASVDLVFPLSAHTLCIFICGEAKHNICSAANIIVRSLDAAAALMGSQTLNPIATTLERGSFFPVFAERFILQRRRFSDRALRQTNSNSSPAGHCKQTGFEQRPQCIDNPQSNNTRLSFSLAIYWRGLINQVLLLETVPIN